MRHEGAEDQRLDTELSPRWLGVANGSSLALLADEAEDYRALVAIDLQLRGVRWRQTTTPRWTTMRVFVFKDMTVLGTPAGEVEAYCPADGTKAWSQRVKGTVRAIGGSEDVLYVGTTEGRLYARNSSVSCSGA